MLTIPRELVHEFVRGNGSVFVGAGLSMGAGLPSWSALVRPLEEEIDGIPTGASLLKVAQYYENEFGRRRLVWQINQGLAGFRAHPTQAHSSLVLLPVRRIFTTNFDSLLEAALTEQQIPFAKVIGIDQLPFADSSQMQLVKLHGDLEHPRSVVITADDYNNYFDGHSALAELLKIELQTRTVLFLGYSFNDFDLEMILSRVSREGRELRRNLFTVQLNPAKVIVTDLERQGLKVIPLSAAPGPHGATQAVSEFLEELRRALSRAASPPPPGLTLKSTNHNLPERQGEFLGRQQEIERVMAGLRSRYPLITIQGFAGIGKTRLAIEVGHACASSHDAFRPGGIVFQWVVWISAKDKPDEKRWLIDVLDAIARTTNFTAITQTADVNRKKAQVELLFETYRILLIIDNFETIEDPELTAWLEEIPAPSKVIFTTRNNQLQQKAWPVTLKGLEHSEALQFLRQQAALMNLRGIEQQSDHRLAELVEVTGANPQAIKLALGLTSGGTVCLSQVVEHLYRGNADQSIDQVFEGLFTWSWNLLDEDARQILLVTPFFVGVSSICREALQSVSGLTDYAFDRGLTRCLDFNLLEEETGQDRTRRQDFNPREKKTGQDRFVIHSMTRAFARGQLNLCLDLVEPARRRCSDYFLNLVRKHVTRPKPEPRYWNALVSDGMLDIDQEWPSIHEVMKWSEQQGREEVLVDFVVLLVHYMDSRFLNLERMSYVQQAIDIVHRLGRDADEALLRIDALGWTYVEEGRLEDAYREILHGFQLAETLASDEREDLRALGYAWRARVRIEQDRPDEARELIQEALSLDCKPWIKTRVHMAAGDIALKEGASEKALGFYQAAADEARRYGDEGRGYQTQPRIGLAYLGSGRLDDAEQVFRELREFRQIAIGKLYAEYGLAMVAYKRGQTQSALRLIDEIKAELSRRTTSNLLLKLINKLFDDLNPGDEREWKRRT